MKNASINLTPGDVVRGKWHQGVYRVMRRLGEGATGVVYLVESAEGPVAMKIGNAAASITSEVNVLQHFSKAPGDQLGPALYVSDDVNIQGETYAFYTMEYMDGAPVLSFLEARGREWAPIFLVQLLGDLDRLHQAGWVFGDLKPDNLMITERPPRIRWFDVGGTTLQGRAVKEFTEFYDRGTWGLGDRKAEPAYDLFAAAMVFIHMINGERFTHRDGVELLERKIFSHPRLRVYQPALKRALHGKYRDAQMMRKDMMALYAKATSKEAPSRKTTTHTPRKQRRKKGGKLVDAALGGSFLLLASVLYWIGQVM
ncbi:serine/threonine protein kinase [Salsuginibacillus halophilus]|uniref:Serine/threonine protein kinase n=1 Tax=Salsuginibacillus halophilus TaxID=517424 RepID=A0A2P8H7S4_9BACI|nr:serine/threonine protein kinase [Salsuginibacillus halophilus]